MPYFKDPSGGLHFLDDLSFAYLLPLGSVQLTDQEAEALKKPTPDQDKAVVWEKIKSERDRRKAGGVKVGTKWFHSDEASKTQHLANKDTARDQLAVGGQMSDFLLDPETGVRIAWKTMDGTSILLTCQLAFDIVKAAKAHDLAIFAVAEQHRVAMEASPDPAAYDFSTNWPKIFGE